MGMEQIPLRFCSVLILRLIEHCPSLSHPLLFQSKDSFFLDQFARVLGSLLSDDIDLIDISLVRKEQLGEFRRSWHPFPRNLACDLDIEIGKHPRFRPTLEVIRRELPQTPLSSKCGLE